MKSNKEWYAVYTRPRWEKKVAELLTKKKIENFCPLNKVSKQWADRKKIIEEPLFKSYVFVCASEPEYLAIKQTDGILNFVYWLGKPAVIKEKEIETIREFLREHRNVQVEKIEVNVNDQIRVISGPLMSIEGEILEVKSKTVKVCLPSLGYAMFAEIEKSNVEVVGADQSFLTNTYYNAAVG
jgi:transcription antitermination factor NusG